MVNLRLTCKAIDDKTCNYFGKEAFWSLIIGSSSRRSVVLSLTSTGIDYFQKTNVTISSELSFRFADRTGTGVKLRNEKMRRRRSAFCPRIWSSPTRSIILSTTLATICGGDELQPTPRRGPHHQINAVAHVAGASPSSSLHPCLGRRAHIIEASPNYPCQSHHRQMNAFWFKAIPRVLRASSIDLGHERRRSTPHSTNFLRPVRLPSACHAQHCENLNAISSCNRSKAVPFRLVHSSIEPTLH